MKGGSMTKPEEDNENSLEKAIRLSNDSSYTKTLESVREWLARYSKTDFKIFSNETDLSVLHDLSTSLAESAKTIDTEDVLKDHEKWRASISEITAGYKEVLEQNYRDAISRRCTAWVTSLDISRYFESAELVDEALIVDPDRPLTKETAQAAIPKVVDNAEQFGKVTKVLVNVIAKTDTGAQVGMSAELTREQAMEQLELDKVLVNGEPQLIAVPKSLNVGYHSQLALVDQSRRHSPGTEQKEDLVPLGSYAQTFIDKVDRRTRTITFKSRKHKPLTVLPDRDEAWQLVEFLLTNGTVEKEGWLDLSPAFDKWTADFRVPAKPDPNGSEMADPYHDMTKLRHHIQSTAKRGRRKLTVNGKGEKKKKIPQIRLLPKINHETYDPVVHDYEEALARAKSRVKK